MRDYVWIIRKLLENGLLTEKDSFILMNGEKAEHISLPFYGTLIITCLLYTSDAADEEDSVDLGGCRIIKKKKKRRTQSLAQIFRCNRTEHLSLCGLTMR